VSAWTRGESELNQYEHFADKRGHFFAILCGRLSWTVPHVNFTFTDLKKENILTYTLVDSSILSSPTSTLNCLLVSFWAKFVLLKSFYRPVKFRIGKLIFSDYLKIRFVLNVEAIFNLCYHFKIISI